MAVAKYKIVRKCPVCGEEFFARTLEFLVLFTQMLQGGVEA